MLQHIMLLYTECCGRVVSTHIWEAHDSNSAWRPAILTEVFHDFPQSIQANALS
jgi:hypothetical protein